MDLSAGDDHDRGNTPAKIQQRVQFDGRFFPAKLRPREKRQTEIDRCGVQRIDGLIEFEAEGFVSVELSRHSD